MWQPRKAGQVVKMKNSHVAVNRLLHGCFMICLPDQTFKSIAAGFQLKVTFTTMSGWML